jgi:hypothetical protein
MKRNVTVQVDETLLLHAKALAAKRDISLSRLLASEIERLARVEVDYEECKRQAIADMERGFDLGGPPYPNRESLHER